MRVLENTELNKMIDENGARYLTCRRFLGLFRTIEQLDIGGKSSAQERKGPAGLLILVSVIEIELSISQECCK